METQSYTDGREVLRALAFRLAFDFGRSRTSHKTSGALLSLVPDLKFCSIAVQKPSTGALVAASNCAFAGALTLALHEAEGTAAGLVLRRGAGVQGALGGAGAALLAACADVAEMRAERPEVGYTLVLPLGGAGGARGALLLGLRGSAPPAPPRCGALLELAALLGAALGRSGAAADVLRAVALVLGEAPPAGGGAEGAGGALVSAGTPVLAGAPAGAAAHAPAGAAKAAVAKAARRARGGSPPPLSTLAPVRESEEGEEGAASSSAPGTPAATSAPASPRAAAAVAGAGDGDASDAADAAEPEPAPAAKPPPAPVPFAAAAAARAAFPKALALGLTEGDLARRGTGPFAAPAVEAAFASARARRLAALDAAFLLLAAMTLPLAARLGCCSEAVAAAGAVAAALGAAVAAAAPEAHAARRAPFAVAVRLALAAYVCNGDACCTAPLAGGAGLAIAALGAQLPLRLHAPAQAVTAAIFAARLVGACGTPAHVAAAHAALWFAAPTAAAALVEGRARAAFARDLRAAAGLAHAAA